MFRGDWVYAICFEISVRDLAGILGRGGDSRAYVTPGNKSKSSLSEAGDLPPQYRSW